MDQKEDACRYSNAGEHSTRDLDPTVGPLALHFARARVDHDLIRLLLVSVRKQPDWQQQVLECDGVVTRDDGMDPLLVAADATPCLARERGFHTGFGVLKSLIEFDFIRPSQKTREQFLPKRSALSERPRFQFVNEMTPQILGRQNQLVVKESLESAGCRIPTCAPDPVAVLARSHGDVIVLTTAGPSNA